MQIHGLQIDQQTRIVRRGDRETTLTPGELIVLLTLVQWAGRVVSTTVLAQHLTPDFADLAPQVIRGYISRLRRKIDHGFSRQLIVNRYGQGFSLRPE